MKNMKRLFFFLILSLLLLPFAGLGQIFPLNLSVQVNPPYTANYASYFTGAGQVVLTINNTSGTTRNIYLAGAISTIDGSIEVRTSGDEPWPGPALLVPPGVHQYSGNDLLPFSENSNVEYTGITQQDIINGILPEGEYQICMRAYDFASYEPLSPAEPQGCSNIFSIQFPPPPQIIGPECGGFVTASTPTNLLFNWQQPSGLPPSVTPRYNFKLVVWPDGIDAQSALESSTDPVFETTLLTPSLIYTAGQPMLLTGRRYAWRVQAFDPLGGTIFQNEGYSEPCSFTNSAAGSGGPFTAIYPQSGDTLPWTYMPVIHRFDPYSNDYVGHNRTFRLRENGSQVDVFTRNMNWPYGPEQSQESALGGMDITQEESQYINLYKRIDNSPAPVQFTHGRRYSWDADIQIENASGSDIFGALSGDFVSGMGRPRPIEPPNGDTVLRSEPLSLRFRTAEAPDMLVP
ncbi:MAG: hypothetical protein KDC13_05835, partial [Bacteroidetes bacterium]|nr:hypothetical protein [Bacteroidota bacterium]